MGDLIDGDDGIVAGLVGEWVKEKHRLMLYYLGTARAARASFVGPTKAGATYIDLFCGSGRAQIRETGEWVDGSAVAAWRASVESGVPFTKMYIADMDASCRSACADRLRKYGAPVCEVEGDAIQAANSLSKMLNQYALHFAFIDPFNLDALDFRIIEKLSTLKRMDMLIHVSAMDINRNTGIYAAQEDSAFDRFAPGWRESVSLEAPYREVKRQVVEHWRSSVAALGKWPSPKMHLITGSTNQPLYWLLLAAGHDLAHKFWGVAVKAESKQSELF